MKLICNWDATRTQLSCNYDATRMQLGCKSDANMMQAGCKYDATGVHTECEYDATMMHVAADDDEDETRLVAGYPTGRRQWTLCTCYALRFGKGSNSNRSERLQPGVIHGHVDEVLFPVVRLQEKAMLLLFRDVHREAGRHPIEQRFPPWTPCPKQWCRRDAFPSVMSSHNVYSSSQLGGTCAVTPCNQTKALPQPTPSCVPMALASKVAPGGLALEELDLPYA